MSAKSLEYIEFNKLKQKIPDQIKNDAMKVKDCFVTLAMTLLAIIIDIALV